MVFIIIGRNEKREVEGVRNENTNLMRHKIFRRKVERIIK